MTEYQKTYRDQIVDQLWDNYWQSMFEFKDQQKATQIIESIANMYMWTENNHK